MENSTEIILGYCICSALSELYQARRKAQALEGRCESYKRNADLDNPYADDLQFLQDYSKCLQSFKEAAHDYNLLLTRSIREKKVTVNVYDHNGKKVRVADCPDCNQHIDILADINAH
jgi:hypothetical protein